MSKRRIVVSIGLIMILTLSVLVVSNQPPKNVFEEPEQPKFVIASWSYPDEYGQGIYGFRFYENSTGSWVAAPFYTDIGAFYFLHHYDPSYTLNWSAGVAMKLRCYTLLNLTLTGAIDEADGQNHQRHSIVVTNLGSIVFSQQNFTYYDVTPYGATPQYEYEVILDFLPDYGQTYTITVVYEIYW